MVYMNLTELWLLGLNTNNITDTLCNDRNDRPQTYVSTKQAVVFPAE